MAQSIVFIMPVPFTEHFARRYGVRILEKKGVACHILDLSKLLNGDVFNQYQNNGQFPEVQIHQVNSYAELESKITELSKTSVFVDYLVGLMGIDQKTEKVFRILKKCGAQYYIISDANLPAPFAAQGDFKKKLLGKYSKIFNPCLVAGYVAKRIIRGLTKAGIYPLPVKVFGIDSANMRNYFSKYDNQTIHRIPINSSDYSTYIEYVRNHPQNRQGSHKTCVFLDEAIVDSYDFNILKIKKLDSAKYLMAMNHLFDRIEKETGMEVIIAAHHSSRYEQYPDAFGHRKIIKGKTIELVAQSSLVVLHSTTAVSYPVLFNKPTLIVKTQEMIDLNRSALIDTLAQELGLMAVNVEDSKEMDDLQSRLKNPTPNNFDAYKYKYLVSKGLEEYSTWDILESEIKKEKTSSQDLEEVRNLHAKS